MQTVNPLINKQRLTQGDKIYRGCLIFDIYSEPVNLILHKGQGSYRTFCGSVMSIITFVTMFFYIIYEVAQMKRNVDYTTSLQVETDGYFADPNNPTRFNAKEMGF